jgi:uncharacterized protein YkwD
LESAIQGHRQHRSIHTFFDHNAPESSVTSPWTRATLCGTSSNGENIAQGYAMPAEVMTGWTNSSGHNANMLDDQFGRVGFEYEEPGRYWGRIFGN